jgi:hypothetical protein
VPFLGQPPSNLEADRGWHVSLVERRNRQPGARGRSQLYKLEKWSKDGMKVECMLYAGNNLDEARELFAEAIKRRGSG